MLYANFIACFLIIETTNVRIQWGEWEGDRLIERTRWLPEIWLFSTYISIVNAAGSIRDKFQWSRTVNCRTSYHDFRQSYAIITFVIPFQHVLIYLTLTVCLYIFYRVSNARKEGRGNILRGSKMSEYTGWHSICLQENETDIYQVMNKK